MNDYLNNVRFAYEYERRLRVGFAGCGGQAFRNLLPSFRFAPIDLIAVCDVDEARAVDVGKVFGAKQVYNRYEAMLENEAIDAVFLATGYTHDGIPTYPAFATLALQSGRHVWMEKPPAASVGEIARLQEIATKMGLQVGVGFMKMFTPAAARIKAIIDTVEFGKPTSFYLRDPEMMPSGGSRKDPKRCVHLLDHIVHPASLIQRLLGPVSRLSLETSFNGAAVISMKCESGACGVLHMPWGQSPNSPMERLEVVGELANIVLENNTTLTYFRRGCRGDEPSEYGRGTDYTCAEQHAPLRWVMDGYSGQPFNMHLFYQGYAPEIIYFANCVLDGTPVVIGSLDDARHIMGFYETLLASLEPTS